MNKENNCQCVVCNVEAALLDSFSTQTARNHFKALANNYPILSHFESPLDVVTKLRRQGDPASQDAGNQILRTLIHAISDKAFEDLGQQLLLVAFTPAIHKIYREVCQRFPLLSPDDVAQQLWVAFLETAKSPALLPQNGQLPVALVMNCRKTMLRWAMKEGRQTSMLQDSSPEYSEPLADDNFEEMVLLEDFLRQARRAGVLSAAQYKLLLKFKYEGFVWKELAEGDGGPSAIALYRRVKRTIYRLRRARSGEADDKSSVQAPSVNSGLAQSQKNILQQAVDFSEEMPFSNSEKEFSPELSRPIPQVGADVTQVGV
jgi:hypothetical protein